MSFYYQPQSTEAPALGLLDTLEGYASEQGWNYRRDDRHELIMQCQKRYCFYGLYFCWLADKHILQFSCIPDLKIPAQARTTVASLLNHMNNYLSIGYMGMDGTSGLLSYRYTSLLSQHDPAGSSYDMHPFGELIETALFQCERFYPVLQMVIWGGLQPKEAMTALLLEPQGHA
ncbi:MAG: YbjN domain-containing protein [Alphaproteobacteria bacterium GM202ARS2]|nr:YbjN domain-containing protein [Alphaproteobacteria bacterium GM202ARS2]